MKLDQALSILSHLQRFNRWKDDNMPDPSQIDAAISAITSEVPSMNSELVSKRRQLARCQVQRERFHLQLRSRGGELSTPPPDHG